MDPQTFKNLVESVKKDPELFHSLVFQPEEGLKKVANLDRAAKGAVYSANAAELIARLIGVVSYCGDTCSDSCGYTCGASSCGHTTDFQVRGDLVQKTAYFARNSGALQYCGTTCESSCGLTCGGGSCGYTTSFQGFGQQVFR